MSYHGECLCGAVKFEINGPIDSLIHCHCSLCRKSTGTAYATNGFVATKDFTINQGGDNLTGFSTSPGKTRYFCKTCGSPVYSGNTHDPERVRIRAGLLNDDIDERPVAHIFAGSKANWDSISGDIPAFDGYEPSRK